MRILYVEDTRDSFDFVYKLLTGFGHEVTWAENGTNGVAKAKSEAPELILLDINMPDMTGFEVAQTLRAAGIKTPIIALTALPNVREQCFAAGMDEFLIKPTDARLLINLVKRFSGETAAPARRPPVLPARPAPQAQVVAPPVAAGNGTSKRILVVEDDPANRNMVQRILVTLGSYAVDTASTSQGAAELVGQHQYDTVITDFNLPGVDGAGLLTLIRKGKNADTPVILFTGEGFSAHTLRALGFEHVIRKPLQDPRVFLATVKKCVESVSEKRKAENTGD